MPDATADRWVDLLRQAAVLKTTPRTGWHLRGVPQPESVAEHSFATALLALVLAEMEPRPVDRAKVLTMALLHDLPESVVSDIPRRGARLLPDGAKETAETAALAEILEGLPVAETWLSSVAEINEAKTVEARLVKAADRLEFLLQTLIYRETTGTRRLDDIRGAANIDPEDEPEPASRLRRAMLRRWPPQE